MLNVIQKRMIYHAHAAVHSMNTLCQKPLATLMTIIVLALALALPALFLVLTDNLTQLTADWQRGGHISLYLKTGMPNSEEKAFVDKLKATQGVGAVTLKSAKEGLDELMQQEGMQDIMRYLPENPLPTVLDVIPTINTDSPAKIDQLYRELKAYPQVDQAKLDMDWINRLHAIFAFAAKVTHALVALLALAVVLIVGNTLRLAIHHRHEEILVLKLVGATDAYITRPFLYQGFWYGLGAALVALFLVNIFMLSLEMAVNQLAIAYKINYPLTGLTVRQVLLLFLFACILGWLGACLSVKRQLASIEPY